MKIAPLVIASAFLFTACNRSAVNEPEPLQYVFTNNLDKPVTVRLQDSSGTLDGATYMSIPAHSFKSAHITSSDAAATVQDVMQEPTFAYYWATDDFKMSDWYSKKPSDWKVKRYTRRPYKGGMQYSIDINPVQERNDLKYCLTGMDRHTEWKVTYAFSNTGANIWDTLSSIKKSMRVVLNYDRSGYLQGTSIGEAYFRYDLVDSTARFLLKNNGEYTGPVIKTANFLRISNDMRPAAALYTESLDMLYMTLGNDKIYYLLARQK